MKKIQKLLPTLIMTATILVWVSPIKSSLTPEQRFGHIVTEYVPVYARNLAAIQDGDTLEPSFLASQSHNNFYSYAYNKRRGDTPTLHTHQVPFWRTALDTRNWPALEQLIERSPNSLGAWNYKSESFLRHVLEQPHVPDNIIDLIQKHTPNLFVSIPYHGQEPFFPIAYLHPDNSEETFTVMLQATKKALALNDEQKTRARFEQSKNRLFARWYATGKDCSAIEIKHTSHLLVAFLEQDIWHGLDNYLQDYKKIPQSGFHKTITRHAKESKKAPEAIAKDITILLTSIKKNRSQAFDFSTFQQAAYAEVAKLDDTVVSKQAILAVLADDSGKTRRVSDILKKSRGAKK